MTKQTKIIISVVLSCTILLLFIPSFASDASTSPTDTNTYLIKAGKYKFNDTLTYSTDINFELTNFNFYTPQSLAFDDANGTVTLVNNPSYFNTFTAFYSTVFEPNTLVVGYSSDLLVYDDANGWDSVFALLSDPSVGLVVDDNVKGYGQIVVVSEDTYVPQNVGIWLNSNWNVMPEYEGNPFTDIMNLVIEALDVPLFGTFSLWDMLTTLCGLFAVVWLLKLLAGG